MSYIDLDTNIYQLLTTTIHSCGLFLAPYLEIALPSGIVYKTGLPSSRRLINSKVTLSFKLNDITSFQFTDIQISKAFVWNSVSGVMKSSKLSFSSNLSLVIK